MNILIPGGTGFLGQVLEDYFKNQDHNVKILTRKPLAENHHFWNAQSVGEWTQWIDWADVVINLAGKSVDCRYTKKNRNAILNSRVESTAVLAQAIQQSENPPSVWINSSSATTYIHAETEQMTEDRGIIGDDFSMNICKQWEHEFFKHDLHRTRRVAMRTAIVLGKSDGAYPQLKKIAGLFLGGKQGNGRQYVSWIHTLDFCRAVEFIIEHKALVGAVNLSAPTPVRNKQFMQKLRISLKKKWGFGMSKWMLELGAAIIKTETELLLKSRNVVPERLLEHGFTFEFATVDEALGELVG